MCQYITALDSELYIEYINRIQKLNRTFTDSIYTEKHHIKPRCLGGLDTAENLIQLLPEEHFIAHKLLTLENPENKKLALAFSLMAFMKSQGQIRYECTAEEYALAKEKASFAKQGKKLTEEHKKHISESQKGHKLYFTRNHTKEEREKMGLKARDYNLNHKDYNQLSEHNKGAKMMTNGVEQHWVYKDDIEDLLAKGWKFGSCKKRKKKCVTQKSLDANKENGKRLKNTVWVHKDNERHQVNPNELEYYYSLGFKDGMKD